MAGLVQPGEKRMEKQMGCMSGFLQIFDRQQILAGKRIHSTKRLPPATGVGASPETESSGEVNENENEFSRESEKPESQSHQRTVVVSASADSVQSSTAEKVNVRRKSPASAPAVADGEKNQRRSPSVIARLMGLEPLSSSDQNAQQTVAKPALARSVSEPRVSRDPVQSKYIDDNNFQVKLPSKSQRMSSVSNRYSVNHRVGESMEFKSENLNAENVRTSPWRSRSYFDSADFFPEPNQTITTMHEDFEKRLKMRGMSEQSNDLSTLKQILDVLQLKGLLHSSSRSSRDGNRNFVYDGHLNHDESSVVLVEPWRFSARKVDYHRSGNDSRGARGYASEHYPAISIKRDGGAVDRSGRIPVRGRTTSSPNRIRSNLKSCNSNSIIKRKPLSIEIRRGDKNNDSSSSPKRSPIHSPNPTPKRNNSVHHHSTINRSRRNQKPTESSAISSPKKKSVKNVVTEDESSSISESIFSTPSTTDSERSKYDGYREGKRLLHRCDELIHNIAEMSSTTESPPSCAVVLPSPVSVLDSGFDSDDSPIPSQSIDFKATPAIDFKDNNRSPKLSPTEPTEPTEHEEFTSNDSNFTYISAILQASQSVPGSSNIFFSIEKQFYNTENTSDVPTSKLQRKLIFDVVSEIVDRITQLPPWKVEDYNYNYSYNYDYDYLPSVKRIWSEFQKIRETNAGDGVLESVIKRDLVETANDWRDYPIETSETVLDIERMIFKDLVSEVIRDLAEFEFSGECMLFRTRRKLVF